MGTTARTKGGETEGGLKTVYQEADKILRNLVKRENSSAVCNIVFRNVLLNY